MAYEPVTRSVKKSHGKNVTTGFRLNGVSVEGFDELAEQFMALGEDLIYRLGPATVECAELIARKAREKAPRALVKNEKGFRMELKDGIIVKKPGRQKSHKAYRIFASVQLSKEASHGIPVELGHRLFLFGRKTLRDIEERPFLRPAADESKNEVANIMIDAMNEILEEYGGK
jgi:HK97 gp10 family phage protein